MNPFALFSVAAVLCFSCAKPDSSQSKQSPPPSEAAENTVVSGVLKEHAAALGYPTEESDGPHVRKVDNPYENADLSHVLEGVDGTFVFFDMQRKIELIENKVRANTPFPPQSTFKIPNTLIALDTGVAAGPDMKIDWNSRKYPKEAWWDTVLAPMDIHWDRPHTLKSAFQNSCVWYYRELAGRIGAQRMQSYLDKFNYGNRDISGGIDRFWLESSLKISAVEQVAFLKKFVGDTLPVREETIAAALSVFERERQGSRVLYAKTGGGENIGWFVGFVQDNEDRYLFAFNMSGSLRETAKRRIDLSMEMLRELGVWF